MAIFKKDKKVEAKQFKIEHNRLFRDNKLNYEDIKIHNLKSYGSCVTLANIEELKDLQKTITEFLSNPPEVCEKKHSVCPFVPNFDKMNA